MSSVSAKHVLLSEILTVTSVMRKNSRWALSVHTLTARDSALARDLGLRRASPNPDAERAGYISREADLMLGFQELKRTIRDIEDITTLPLPALLGPFLALIRSPLSTGPITSTALSSLHNFFVCGLISGNSQSLDVALAELSNSVSRCKFEASDSTGDEVALLKIMTVIHDCICGSDIGDQLGDAEICEMLETVLTTCCQMRLSEILRRSADSTMHMIVRRIFSKLHTLDPATEEAKLQVKDETGQEGEIKVSVSGGLPEVAQGSAEAPEPQKPETEKENDGSTEEQAEQTETLSQHQVPPEHPGREPSPTETPTSAPIRPYGLFALLELLRVVVNILDPNDQIHTDSTRLMALGLLNAISETCGSRLGDFPSLSALIVDPACKFLFQLARSDNPSVLQAALRTITTVFETMRPHLKLQQELFLAFTIDRLAPPASTKPPISKRAAATASPRPGTPVSATPDLKIADEADAEKGSSGPSRPAVAPARGDSRDLMLETLSHICRHPSFMVDLYVNYDCDINCENLFERLVDFLTKGVYPWQSSTVSEAQQLHSQYLCLDLLLAFVNDMAARMEGSAEPWPDHFTSPDELMQKRAQKKLVTIGAAKFNSKPKLGLAFFEENKLIYSDQSSDISRAQSLAKFLKSCTRLDKKLLGEYISRPENIDVLRAFLELFDFRGKHIADAMREMLETFRLPGEAQQISRITETFASVYFASEPAEVKSEDAIYVLAYSVILLNTDLHNPQIRKRMTIEDYTRNLRGVNDNSNFSPEFLQSIYDSIRKREIVMPEEHTGQLGFEYAWKELLARSRQAGSYLMCNSPLFDLDMFKAVWKPLISAIAYAFISFDDEYVIQRAISGFRQCATLAGYFQLPDVFDFVVVSLSQATSLLSDDIPVLVPNYPIVDVEGQSVTVSSVSVKFGTNFKGQLAAVVLFNIVNGNGNALREGWTQIFEMFQNLFIHSLLPTRMLQMEDFLGGVSMIPLRGSQPSKPAPRSDGGLLSTLSSYLMTPYGASGDNLVPEATDAGIESTLCTIDCITSCRLDELYAQIIELDPEALVAAIRALEALAHDRTIARLKQETDEDGAPFESSTTEGGPRILPYDPASVFLLETMVSIASQTSQHIEELWPILFEHLSALLSAASHFSVLLIERAVVALLRLCLIITEKNALRDQLYLSLDLLAGLPVSVANSVAEQVVAGVKLIMQHENIISSQTEWNLIFAVLRSTISNPEAARSTYDMVVALANDRPQQRVTPDNFAGLLTVLDGFANGAGVAVTAKQVRGRRAPIQPPANTPAIERGKAAIDLIFELKRFFATFAENSQLSPGQVWHQFCLPLVSVLGKQSSNPSRLVRHTSVGQLQRVLLGPHLSFDNGDHSQVEEIFNNVIFPMLDELLKPAVYQLDPPGMSETRLRASALLCKAFMHFEVRESRQKTDIRVLWIEVLDLLDRLIQAEKSEQLYEAISESLKNVVLVMNAANILVPPSSPDERDEHQRTLWAATQARIDRFLPRFLSQVLGVGAVPVIPDVEIVPPTPSTA
ncbi:Sec7-domain-containing protein [Coniophora puteana RWD-64-598 SS2]|uniref:Sec7-domain-containing protein n=1 Tax=Coniophora puteana (strain RWD-64-598) TaxID=741705 RepID=A0A5M3N3G6_CONPW|nr:Sec7-domain-containing protein [Coniophora puteana RWD-64-598 SS2]EIW85385.1 Sec7-domain-containing protein [Coniophora puteana RWD-64-598 SS2]